MILVHVHYHARVLQSCKICLLDNNYHMKQARTHLTRIHYKKEHLKINQHTHTHTDNRGQESFTEPAGRLEFITKKYRKSLTNCLKFCINEGKSCRERHTRLCKYMYERVTVVTCVRVCELQEIYA